MAQIDASGLSFNYDVIPSDNTSIVAVSGSGPDYYSWDTNTTSPLFRFTLLSFSADITVSPLAGTINSVNITNDAYAPGIGITGLNVGLASLIDTANPNVHYEKFWEAVLEGATTIILPSTAQTFTMMGDYVLVNAGQTLTGGADRFIGVSKALSTLLTGDAISVAANATLNGGADVFDNAFASGIYGDVAAASSRFSGNAGTVNGGNDRISLVENGAAAPSVAIAEIAGDILSSSSTAFSKGGADTITLRNIASVSTVAGDVTYNYGTSTGGADTILIETTLPGRAFISAAYVAGDDLNVRGTTAKSTGGADSITLNNVNSVSVSGDFSSVEDGVFAKGGNDTIIYRGSFAETSPAATYELDPLSEVVSGDADRTAGAGAFTGGNDTIRLVNVRSATITGDVNTGNATGKFIGGNDFISVVYNRSASEAPGFGLYGETNTGYGKDFTGGNDRLTLDVRASLAGGALILVGDAYALNCESGAVIHNGNDSLALIANTGQGGTLYGDGEEAIFATPVPGSAIDVHVIDGDDTLTGGDGGDRLFGDTIYVGDGSSGGIGGRFRQDGGSDVLDGRGGNDTINGGGGIDTVVFGLDLSVHVNLNGIPGSGATPADWIEAIGQGNDQLTGIENVTGSSQADVIIGNAAANIINGMAGADQMAGGAGNDTYHVDAAGDITTENANAGTDLVISTISRTLGNNLENLTLSGTAIIDGNGNALANLITGNAAANTLRGYDGSDTLVGNAGADLLIGGNARDVLKPGIDTSRDTIKFAAVAESTGPTRDIVYDMDLNGEDRFDFVAVPTSIHAMVTTGALDTSSFDANLTAAIGVGQMGVGQAVLFDPSAGNLNQAGHLYLVVDANGVAGYQAGADHVIELFNAVGTLTLDDFI